MGVIVTKRLSITIPKFSEISYIVSLGIILFTAINYFSSIIFSFPTGIYIAHFIVILFEIFYFLKYKINLNFLPCLQNLFKEKLLFILTIIIGLILFTLFNHHIIPSVKGNLQTGESTYGDLPFHLSIISHIAYGYKFPPDNPFYANAQLAYPYLINFFSAILVFEGWSLRLSIIIPGLMLSLSLIGLIYDFTYNLTRDGLKSFFAVLLYFFNGGLGFIFFLSDYSFNLTSIIQALLNPTMLKEYSHLFEQNIQWGNFLSRMIIPERSLLFGIPAGIIILRLLFFKNTDRHHSIFDLVLAALLISLMPLMHTHTVLAMAITLPLIGLLTLARQYWKIQLRNYIFVMFLTVIFALPHIPVFLNHISGSESFFKPHLWWMKSENESIIWFWFKNTYLFIPLSLIILIFPLATKWVKILQVNALILLVIINLALFSPYNWDNVKFLFWAGLFFSVSAASFFTYLFKFKYLSFKIATVLIIITMISSALLSIWREINVTYLLFSKEAVETGEKLKEITPRDSIFLTYKLHNSPVSNLAGRSIMMGYPGLLWVHGINYQDREKDINEIFAGADNAKPLIEKNSIDYIVVESSDPQDMYINRAFLNQYPIILDSGNYSIYKVR